MAITRKQSKASQSSQQDVSTPSTNEPPVSEPPISLKWLWFDPADEVQSSEIINIPLSLFQKESRECRSLFCHILLEDFEIKITQGNIRFWKPEGILLEETVSKPGWATTIGKISDICKPIIPSQSFAEVLDRSNEDALHLVVAARNSHLSTAVPEPWEHSHPMYDDLQDMVANPGLAPSSAAKSSNYFNIQATENQALHDGRYPVYSEGYPAPVKRVVTMAPPIEIYHPVFHKFLRYISDPPERLTEEFLQATIILMRRLSGIDLDEDVRNLAIRASLSRILGVTILEQTAFGKSHADGSYFVSVKNVSIPIFVMELDREIGAGECDPSTQAGFFMRRSWIDGRRSVIRDKCCCPGFIIAGAGPWMGVLGSVMTDKFITQRLTNLQWCGLSSTSEDARIYRFARVLNALRLCIGELEQYYTGLGDATNIKLPPHDPHPRYFPYPNSFTDEDNGVVRFEYLRALEEGEPTCVTFLAKTAEKQIVVKFVSRYGADAHRFLAAEGHAPRLLYHGPLPDTKAIPITRKYSSLSLGSMQMVVMDYISPCQAIPLDAKQQLGVILNKFHTAGYVFGDLREQNVIFDEEQKAHLIDFDWAGRFDRTIVDPLSLPGIGTTSVDSASEPPRKKTKVTSESEDNGDNSSDSYVCYPLNISTALFWPAGVEPLGPIRPIHDVEMLKNFGMKP